MPRKPASVKLDDVREKIEELKKEEKKLVQEQSKEVQKQRTHRLCKRGGEVEKLLPDLKTLTEEQFYLFVEKTLLTDSTKRILADIVAGNKQDSNAPIQEGMVILMCGFLFILCTVTLLLVWIFR